MVIPNVGMCDIKNDPIGHPESESEKNPTPTPRVVRIPPPPKNLRLWLSTTLVAERGNDSEAL